MSVIMYKQRFAPPKDRFTPIKNYLHVGYIAMRPRSMKNEDGVHGLFGYLSPADPCDQMPWQDTARYVRKLSKRGVNIFRGIISFNRSDAEELGLVAQADWREYAEQHIRSIADKNGIAIENLGWCGAYHNEGEHPHLHVVFWNKTQDVAINFVKPKVGNDIRVALIKETFADRIAALYEQKKLAKENISGNYDKAVSEFDEYMKAMRANRFKATKSGFETYGESGTDKIRQLFNSNEQLIAAAERLFKLRGMIPKGGRIEYKLLPPEVKAEIDGMTDELIKENIYLQRAVGQYVDSQCELKRLYNSLDDPEKLKAFRDKCESEAKTQISYKIVKSIKEIISKEYEGFAAARKQYYAMELMREILDFFARGVVANNSKYEELRGKTFGDLSERAMKEWYLKNKDRGMEF